MKKFSIENVSAGTIVTAKVVDIKASMKSTDTWGTAQILLMDFHGNVKGSTNIIISETESENWVDDDSFCKYLITKAGYSVVED